jgi:hypothetical protein
LYPSDWQYKVTGKNLKNYRNKSCLEDHKIAPLNLILAATYQLKKSCILFIDHFGYLLDHQSISSRDQLLGPGRFTGLFTASYRGSSD